MDIIEYSRFIYHSLFVRKQIYTQKEDSIFSIDYNRLKKKEVRLLIFDVDDTLTWHRGELEEKTLNLLKTLSKKFKVAIFTNSGKKRRKQVEEMVSGIEIYVSPYGEKPGKKGFLHLLDYFKLNPGYVAMIGDRLGTDIWGAYATGIKCRILLTEYPLSKKKTVNALAFIREIERRFS